VAGRIGLKLEFIKVIFVDPNHTALLPVEYLSSISDFRRYYLFNCIRPLDRDVTVFYQPSRQFSLRLNQQPPYLSLAKVHGRDFVVADCLGTEQSTDSLGNRKSFANA